MSNKKTLIITIIGLVTIVLLAIVVYFEVRKPRTWSDVEKERTIRVVTANDNVNYTIVDGRPIGFCYELIKNMADSMGLTLDVTIDNQYSSRVEGLRRGDYDLMLDLIPITLSHRQTNCITSPIATSQLVLLQIDKKYQSNDSIKFVSNVTQLDSVQLYILSNSEYRVVLDNIMLETGVEFDLVGIEGNNADLNDMLEKGDISYAAVDRLYYEHDNSNMPILNCSVELGFEQYVGWGTADQTTQKVISEYIDSVLVSSWFAQLKRSYDIR